VRSRSEYVQHVPPRAWQGGRARSVDQPRTTTTRASEERRLVGFLLANCALGIVVGWAILASLILLDVGRLGQLLFASEHWLPTLVLAGAGFASTFGGVAVATAIFLLPKD
jgi:hypothetical protein